MIDEIFKVKLISVRDCFLHFSSQDLQKLLSKSLSSTVKLIPHNNDMAMYFTWLPQPCNGLEEQCVGISSVYANSLGLAENAIVVLSTCDQFPVVKTVFVSAATQDDYEMMEMSQNELQLSLLDQVRVVSVNQPVIVWFSKTLHCTLYIDSMDMLVKRGRLEQLTDIVISPSIVQAEDKVIPTSGPTYNTSEFDNKTCITSGLRSDENSCNGKLNEIVKKGKNPEIFRVIVLNYSSCCNNLHNNIKHPYNAFIMKEALLSWASTKIETNSAVVCSLSVVSSKLTKDLYENKSDSGVYIRLYPVQDDCQSIPNINCGNNFKNPVLYLSNTVKNILNLRNGSKVKLKLFTPCLDKKISHVELSFTNSLSKKEVESWFREDLSKNSNTLVNNNLVMPVESCIGTVEQVIVSLWPATIPCWPFSSAELKSCKLSLNYIEEKEFNKSDDNESDKSKHDSDNDEDIEPASRENDLNVLKSISHQSKTLGDIVKEGLLSFEMSLGFSTSSVLSACEPVRKSNNVLCVGSGAYILVDWLCNWLSGSPYNVFISKIDCKSLKGKKGDNIQKRLTEKLLRCIYYQPSLLVLLDLDAIAGTPSQPENKVEEIYLQGIGRMIRDILLENQFNQSVGILATARSSNSLNSEIVGPRSYHLFPTLLQIPTLSKDDRIIVIKEIIKRRAKVNNFNSFDLEEFAVKTDGYNCEDLLLLADKAFFNAWQRKVKEGTNNELLLTLDDLLCALDSYTPTHLHSINLYKGSGHSWSSVGGMKTLKESLTEIIIWPSKFRKVYDQCPLTSESGVLLFGVPGTGKTLLSSALAGEAGLNFISIKGPELLSKYIGASEEAVRKVFEKARKAKPCILFFDEFDSLAPRRGHDSSGVMDRVVNQLLTQMDGIEDRTGVYIIAATSRPDLIDPALLRPGRIGHTLHCPLPDTEDRLEIMRVLSRKLVLDEDCNLSIIADRTAGFSGADLQALIYGAQMLAYDDLMNEENMSVERDSDDFSVRVEPDVANKLVVKNSHLLASLKDTNPSLKLEELRRYQRIYDNFQKMRSKSNQDETLPVEIAHNQKVTLA